MRDPDRRFPKKLPVQTRFRPAVRPEGQICQNTTIRIESSIYWALVKGFNLGYHNKESMLFAVDPYYDYGDLN